MKEVIVRSISGLLFIVIMVAALLGGVLWYSPLFGDRKSTRLNSSHRL